MLLKFFHLQVRIHHPNGAVEGSASAYACSWDDWHKHLRSLYSVLCDQINNNIHVKFKPMTIFSGQQNNLDILHNTFASLIVSVFRQVFIFKTFLKKINSYSYKLLYYYHYIYRYFMKKVKT